MGGLEPPTTQETPGCSTSCATRVTGLPTDRPVRATVHERYVGVLCVVSYLSCKYTANDEEGGERASE